jgi:cytochrome c553
MVRRSAEAVLFAVCPVAAAPALAGATGAAPSAEPCAARHGAALEGEPDWQSPRPDGTLPAPPHDASGHTWHHGDGLLTVCVRRSGAAVLADLGVGAVVSAMPGFGETLSDEDIAAVLDYIKSTWPPRTQAIQRVRTKADTRSGSP